MYNTTHSCLPHNHHIPLDIFLHLWQMLVCHYLTAYLLDFLVETGLPLSKIFPALPVNGVKSYGAKL